MSAIFTLPRVLFTPGAKLYFFQSGTSTPQNTYQDADLTTPHANPVVAGSDGYFAPIFLDPSLPDYRVTLKDSADATQSGYPVDDVAAAASGINKLYARKTSSTVKTSTTTLASDTDLHVALPSAGQYQVEIFLWFEKGAGTGAGGIRFLLDYTGSLGSPGALMVGPSYVNATTANVGPTDAYTTVTTFATLGASDYLRWTGIVDADSAGTLSLQWAQNTSSAQSSTLRVNSYMTAERVA